MKMEKAYCALMVLMLLIRGVEIYVADSDIYGKMMIREERTSKSMIF